MKPLLITHGLSHKEALNIVLQGKGTYIHKMWSQSMITFSLKGMKTDQFWKDTYTMIQKVGWVYSMIIVLIILCN